MNLAFDDKGRMWCTSSAEYPWAIKKDKWKTPEGLLDGSKDKILIFSDSDGDGVVDKPSVFADNLNIPIGILPYKNGCIAWSIPNIWRLEDTDGDGKCDKRTILFGPLGWEMDTHGMISSLVMGPDGWIYATHGFNNTSHIKVLPQNNPASVGPSVGTTLIVPVVNGTGLSNFEITQTKTLLENNPSLALSLRNRIPYIDPLSHLQVDLLRRLRSGQGDAEELRRAVHLTINGVAAGLRNSG